MTKNATKMRHFQAKISKIPTPTGEGNTPDQTLTLGIYLCTYFFCFFGHCTYKSSHGKALIWSGKVMEIDFSKVVGTMDQAFVPALQFPYMTQPGPEFRHLGTYLKHNWVYFAFPTEKATESHPLGFSSHN